MIKYDTNAIHARVSDMRNIFRMSQADVADYLGLKRTTYRRREKEGDFLWEHIEQLAVLFTTSPIFIAYGIDDDELRTLAKMLKQPEPNAFSDTMFTFFDDLDEKEKELGNYASFLCLDEIERNRILRHILDNNLAD